MRQEGAGPSWSQLLSLPTVHPEHPRTAVLTSKDTFQKADRQSTGRKACVQIGCGEAVASGTRERYDATPARPTVRLVMGKHLKGHFSKEDDSQPASTWRGAPAPGRDSQASEEAFTALEGSN